MKLVIPGGSGQVGAILARAWHARGHELVVLSRSHAARRTPASATTPWRVVAWDARGPGDWERELDGADAVVSLAGRSVNCRYGARNRELILRSRVDAARAVGEAIARAARPPRAWLQASTATIYAHRFDAPNDEAHGLIGGVEPGVPETWRFSIDVARAWERAAEEACPPSTRLVLLRSAMTMSPDPGGIFATLLALVRLGLGGRAGDGRQFVSWIHEHDFIDAVDHLLAAGAASGAYNLASPHPLPQADFMRELRHAWGMPIGLPATRWMLEAGALFLRTETELILKSRRVVPGRLLAEGFTFRYPEWPDAARELCARVRAGARRAA